MEARDYKTPKELFSYSGSWGPGQLILLAHDKSSNWIDVVSELIQKHDELSEGSLLRVESSNMNQELARELKSFSKKVLKPIIVIHEFPNYAEHKEARPYFSDIGRGDEGPGECDFDMIVFLFNRDQVDVVKNRGGRCGVGRIT